MTKKRQRHCALLRISCQIVTAMISGTADTSAKTVSHVRCFDIRDRSPNWNISIKKEAIRATHRYIYPCDAPKKKIW